MIRTMIAASLAVLLATAPALAEPAKSYTLKLTAEQLNVIGAALGEMKAKDVMSTVIEINRQIAEQDRPADPPPAAPPSAH